MSPKRTSTNSRANKKQIIVYLTPDQVEAAYAKAASEDKTNTEVLGEAINAVFAYYGRAAPVKLGHDRIVRRAQVTQAAVRSEKTSVRSRAGRISYSAWYDTDIVRLVKTMASEQHLNMQSFVEFGVQMITGIDPTFAAASADRSYSFVDDTWVDPTAMLVDEAGVEDALERSGTPAA
jgi:hypothetical protein